MVSGSDRRALLRLAVAAALAPTLASRAAAAAQPGSGRFAPPAGPMTFTRRLVRSLADGNELTVSRGFVVQFASLPAGWSVTGEQVQVTVDFPERLAPLAALERQRKETGLFPLLLDRSGLIVGGPEGQPAQELDQAVAHVMRGFEHTAHTAAERQENDAFVRAVHEAGSRITSLLPAQLFAPPEESTRAKRDLALPDGGQGTIEVSFTALADPRTHLMRQARRDIVTTIAGDSRLTREEWTLVPI